MNLVDREILKASDTIDQALSHMTVNNRGETARNILNVVRNLNDHIASKIWSDLFPAHPMDINKVARQFNNVKKYKYIGRFDTFLRRSVSHFTPSEDGAERLLIKYYSYLIEHKRVLRNQYQMNIIHNIESFLGDIDNQTRIYYNNVVDQLKQIDYSNDKFSGYDNYYVTRVKPFFVQQKTYYEVTLEPAEGKPNKFNRIIAFTNQEILTNYSVALRFVEKRINAFDVKLPIKIITDWKVSIRPCEINNFAKIFYYHPAVTRNLNEYKYLMDYLTEEMVSLVDIIDYSEDKYDELKSSVVQVTRENNSRIFKVLDMCRDISINNKPGCNIIRYLLLHLNNRVIKDQWPYSGGYTIFNLYLSPKCRPFDEHPFAFHPKGHETNLYDILDCISLDGRKAELLARKINENTDNRGVLYTSIQELIDYGNEEEISQLIKEFNSNLYEGFRPQSELREYKKYIYNYDAEAKLRDVILKLIQMSETPSYYLECFSEDCVCQLESLPDMKERLDDPVKKDILINLFGNSRVHFIYGSAGTGKSTLINHVAKLMANKKRVFLAKTNPAVENLRRKVVVHETSDLFLTIDKFTKNYRYDTKDYDLIVVDECSTVKNEEIFKILNMAGEAVLILAGDIYQIQAIGFGNWFKFAKQLLPSSCCSELKVPYRSTDENLKELWNDVREMKPDNVVLEEIVRSDYSHAIDQSIFVKKSKDEIILCLNYNGLYGLNNINRLLQLGNDGKHVEIGIWQFREGDPVLFNDSQRFEILYNNLKGRIVEIADKNISVTFVVEVDLILNKEEIDACEGLMFVGYSDKGTLLQFSVDRRPPYSSDNDDIGNGHILPFQVAYAVSIHKSQGLEYESVKIVIADDSEDQITHSIFYTAITRAKNDLTIYWSPEVCNRVLKKLYNPQNDKDYLIFKDKFFIN